MLSENASHFCCTEFKMPELHLFLVIFVIKFNKKYSLAMQPLVLSVLSKSFA